MPKIRTLGALAVFFLKAIGVLLGITTIAFLVKYLGRTARTNKWILTSAQRAGVVYEALLRADLFEAVLHGIRSPEPRVIMRRARSAATVMWRLMEAGILGAD